MAEQLPRSQFVGVDLSRVQIDMAGRQAQELGLENIKFHGLNLLDLGPDFGEFDYIICHGVFSWVSRTVQDKILEICSSRLKSQGVAYVSYNTYPAWHTRRMVRDMMCYHASRFTDPRIRIQKARGLLDFLIGSTAGNTPYGTILRAEAQALRNKDDGYLFHDELEEINSPIYFAQFAGQARAKGLQYLAEAELPSMWSRHLPPGVATALEQMTADLIEREQYIDFVRNREFRKTLLCHADLALVRDLHSDGLGQFHVAAPLAQLGSGIDFHSPEGVMFRHLFSHQDLTANSPLWKGALLCLAEAWPGSIPISKLASLARVRAGLQKPVDGESLLDDERLVGKSILDLYLCGFAEIHSTPSRFCTQLTARPHASPLARLQAASGNRLTNLRHEVVVVDNLGRYLLPYLDGSHDHGALTSILERGVEDGLLAVAETGQPGDSKQDLKIQFAKVLDRTLQGLALAALLSG